MFTINELTGEMNITRGDSAQFTLFINAGTELAPSQYTLASRDNVYMAIEQPNERFETASVKKVINTSSNLLDSDGNLIINLKSSDTQYLAPGQYYYELKIRIYKQNRYQNLYIEYIFDEDNFTYSVYDSESATYIETGTYTINDTTITLISNSGEQTIGTLYNETLTINNTKYLQEEDGVSTIIPRTQFIIEE